VRFARADITRLDEIGDGSIDAVISTMTLHHLPNQQVLGQCFGEIRRILAPGGAIYIADFTRLKSLASVGFFVGMNADRQPVLFTQDYENSLKAAFSIADYDRLLEQYLPQDARRYSVFLVPLLTVLQTPPRTLAPGARKRFLAARRALPDAYRHDLDDLRLFMRLGGMRQDPFGSR
jgi:SAM-dependent methyltransferase